MFSNYTVIFDACVLYPSQLRDLLITLAGTGLFRARWTDQIHEEWIGAVVARNPAALREKLERTRRLMNQAVPDCLVTGYEQLIDGLALPDPNDRHVLAAAIRAGADAIITSNLKHFPKASLGQFQIEAQHPDEFVCYQIDLNPEVALSAIQTQRARLRKPPVSAAEFLQSLSKHAPLTVEMLNNRIDLI